MHFLIPRYRSFCSGKVLYSIIYILFFYLAIICTTSSVFQ